MVLEDIKPGHVYYIKTSCNISKLSSSPQHSGMHFSRVREKPFIDQREKTPQFSGQYFTLTHFQVLSPQTLTLAVIITLSKYLMMRNSSSTEVN